MRMINTLTKHQIELFMSHVKVMPSGCHEWQAYRNPKGYGQWKPNNLPSMTASRVAYMIAHGEIDDNLLCCHHCDNRACVNPDHLFLGTAKDNLQDMIRKGRAVLSTKGEHHGRAKLTEADVLEIRRLHASGVSQRALSKKYEMSKALIHAIVHRKYWTHI